MINTRSLKLASAPVDKDEHGEESRTNCNSTVQKDRKSGSAACTGEAMVREANRPNSKPGSVSPAAAFSACGDDRAYGPYINLLSVQLLRTNFKSLPLRSSLRALRCSFLVTDVAYFSCNRSDCQIGFKVIRSRQAITLGRSLPASKSLLMVHSTPLLNLSKDFSPCDSLRMSTCCSSRTKWISVYMSPKEALSFQRKHAPSMCSRGQLLHHSCTPAQKLNPAQKQNIE